jgi:hypothetical protein
MAGIVLAVSVLVTLLMMVVTTVDLVVLTV